MLSRDYTPGFLVKGVATILYFLLSLFGLTANVNMTVIFYMGHRHFSQRPFYIAARHLLIADFLTLFAQITVAVPMSLMPHHLSQGKNATALLTGAKLV